jgi:tRNA A-37 threonylcarbamoyl transferase component Bud32
MTSLPPRVSGELTVALADRYRIERELGQGGMATVYLALDLKHARNVAIKVLRPELAAVIGAERFVREIRTIAALQHPHILGLIDSGEVSGTAYYVMPFVEGESLRDRLVREKQLPIGDAVRIATEVASALDYAHRHGVIHRDIKPENILLHDERALVADFGIALAVSQAGGTRMTETGMSLGTPHYMSPEQAMGEREITARSDVYALGAVTYEMLTGDPPFTGSTAQAIVARVLTESPRPLTAQRHTIPEHVEAAVLTALEKLPADRWPSAADFARALEGRGDARPAVFRSRATPATRRGMLVAAGALAAGLIAGAAGTLAIRGKSTAVASTPTRYFEITLPDSAPLDFFAPSYFGMGRNGLAISPDGKTLVYVARVHGHTQLYRRRLDTGETAAIPGTEKAADPVFSPDGGWIAFNAEGELRKVPVAGGTVTTLAPLRASWYAPAWLPDGRIVATDVYEGFRSVPASGGAWTQIAGGGPPYVQALPDSRWMLAGVDAWWSQEKAPVLVKLSDTTNYYGIGPDGPVQGGKGKLVGSSPLYAASGHLLLIQDSTLVAVPFDLEKMRTRGEPAAILNGVRSENSTHIAQLALSGEGTLLYAPGGRTDLGLLVTIDPGGKVRDTLNVPSGAYNNLRLSPDGRFVSLHAEQKGKPDQLSLVDLATGIIQPMTSDSSAWVTGWMPKGHRALLSSSSGTVAVSVSGDQAPDTLTRGTTVRAVSIDERHLLVTKRGASDTSGSWLVTTSDQSHGFRFSTLHDWANFSPDGRWFVYLLKDGVYVSPVDAPATRIKVGPQGADEPQWSHRGDIIYYRVGPRWMAIPVSTANGFHNSAPREALNGHFMQMQGQSYDIDPQDHLVVFVSPTPETTTRLEVITGFFDVLRREAPTR